MLCVVVALAFTAQATVVALDRIEHALGHEHDANPVAGTVQLSKHDHDHDHDTDNNHHGLSHVHTGDTAVSFTLAYVAVDVSRVTLTPKYSIVSDRSAPPSQTNSLDRPPKA